MCQKPHRHWSRSRKLHWCNPILPFRCFLFTSCEKIKRLTGTQRNNQKVWPFAFFFFLLLHFFVLVPFHCIAEQCLHHLNSWPHIERRTTCCDGQYKFWLVVPSHGFIVYFFILPSLRGWFSSLLFFSILFAILIGEISDEKRLNGLKWMQRKEAKKNTHKNSQTEIEKMRWWARSERHSVCGECVIVCAAAAPLAIPPVQITVKMPMENGNGGKRRTLKTK